MKKDLPKCPKCNAEKVRAFDMSPLWFPEKKQCEEEGYDIGIDNYVYLEILCDACDHRYNQDFFFCNNYTTGDNLALNTILDTLEPTSELHKSLKKVIESLGHVKKNDELSTQPIKQTTMCEVKYNVIEVLKSVETIASDKELTAELRKEYGTEFDMITACVKDNFVKPEAIALILRIAPTVYKIGGKLFLKGETKGKHDLIGDDMDYVPVTELFDMTTEMTTGDSYSFYVSTTEHFELATPEEIIKVKNFLDNLYKTK
jgi:hypothetical protein